MTDRTVDRFEQHDTDHGSGYAHRTPSPASGTATGATVREVSAGARSVRAQRGAPLTEPFPYIDPHSNRGLGASMCAATRRIDDGTRLFVTGGPVSGYSAVIRARAGLSASDRLDSVIAFVR